jgi:heterotetrameric sarcosine oxidase delta subunit
MGFEIECPACGRRSYHEFTLGGELRPYDPEARGERSYEQTWLRANAGGEQAERWFDAAGCRRWLTVRRDTRTNEVLGAVGERRT